jgi:hypothetical protein
MGFLIRENASLAEIAWDCETEWSDAGGEGSRFFEVQEGCLAWVRALSRVWCLVCGPFAGALMWQVKLEMRLLLSGGGHEETPCWFEAAMVERRSTRSNGYVWNQVFPVGRMGRSI